MKEGREEGSKRWRNRERQRRERKGGRDLKMS